jgi:hypothetical protein
MKKILIVFVDKNRTKKLHTPWPIEDIDNEGKSTLFPVPMHPLLTVLLFSWYNLVFKKGFPCY